MSEATATPPAAQVAPPSTPASPPSALDRYASGDAFSDPNLLKIMGGLGLAGGALGGIYEYMAPDDPDETPSQRRMRALRSALLSGGAGALIGLGGKATYDMLGSGEGVKDEPGFLDKALGFAAGDYGRTAGGLGLGAIWARRGRWNTANNLAQREYLLNRAAADMNELAARDLKHIPIIDKKTKLPTGDTKLDPASQAVLRSRMKPNLSTAGAVGYDWWKGSDLDSARLADKFKQVTDSEMDSGKRSELRRYGLDVDRYRPGSRWADFKHQMWRNKAMPITGALAYAAPSIFNWTTGGE